MSNHNKENIFNKQCRMEEKKPILDLIQSKDPMEKNRISQRKKYLVKSSKCTNENCKFKGEREMSWKKRTAPGSDKPVGDLWWFRCTASKCTTWKSCRAHSFFEMFQLTLTTLLTYHADDTERHTWDHRSRPPNTSVILSEYTFLSNQGIWQRSCGIRWARVDRRDWRVSLHQSQAWKR